MEAFCFAVMGCGRITVKFCQAVQSIPGCKVVAAASQSLPRAQEFAARNGIPLAFGDYEEMLHTVQPDCVYIGAVTSMHAALSMLCLRNHTPVLCEKAMFPSLQEARETFALAEKERVFVMEAMWSKFMPCYQTAQEWIDAGRIGTPVLADVSVGFLADPDPAQRYYNRALGGGVAYDMTVYGYELMTGLIRQPIREIGTRAVFSSTGVDLSDQITLRFSECFGSIQGTFLAEPENRLVICGTKGRVTLTQPSMPTEAALYDTAGRRVEQFRDTVTENGFVYEAREAMRCIRAGMLESEVHPHRCTLDCAGIFDRISACRTAASAGPPSGARG
jgi:predicted dehydrogenase